jgi:hypothetical protein
MSVDFNDSREALSILDAISAAIQRGVVENKLQHTPHIVVLDRDFYSQQLKPLLVRWQLLYLRSKRLPNIEDKHLLSYMTNGPLKDHEAASKVSVALDDDFMKMLNLSHDLINNLFVNGHDPPRRSPYDLKNHRFFLREYSCIKTNGIAPAPK